MPSHSARFLYRYNLKLCLGLNFSKLTPASKLNTGSDSCFLHLTLLPKRMSITDSTVSWYFAHVHTHLQRRLHSYYTLKLRAQEKNVTTQVQQMISELELTASCWPGAQSTWIWSRLYQTALIFAGSSEKRTKYSATASVPHEKIKHSAKMSVFPSRFFSAQSGYGNR